MKKLFWTAGITVLFWTILIICFDVLYGLNDDLMIQNILSGQFTGTPEGMTVYMAQPLSGFLALLYRMCGNLPWLGLFFVACYVFCFGLILYRVLDGAYENFGRQDREGRSVGMRHGRHGWLYAAVCVIIWILIFCAFLFPQYLLIHYTVVAAVMGSCGIFLMVTIRPSDALAVPMDSTAKTEGKRSGFRDYVAPLILLLLCFMIRRQIFFLLLPFLAVGILFRIMISVRDAGADEKSGLIEKDGLAEKDGLIEKDGLTEKNGATVKKGLGKAKDELCFGLALAVGTVLLMALHMLCYSGAWSEYSAFNQSRTELYDYTGIWEGGAARGYYESVGVSPERLELYLSYDILLDEDVSAEIMEKMAAFRPSEFGIDSPMEVSLSEAVWAYKNRTIHAGEDFPYNYLAIFLYVFAAVALVAGRMKRALLCELLMGVGRCVIWIYLLMGGRFPERVSFPLYLAEAAVLLGMSFYALGGRNMSVEPSKGIHCVRWVMVGVLMAVMAVSTVVTVPKALREQEELVAGNRQADVLFDYMENHLENLYLLDVYAAVGRTGYAVKNYKKGSENYLLLGGWTAGSPLLEKKLQGWGYESAVQALLSGDPVRLAIRDGEGAAAESGITVGKLEACFAGLTLEQMDVVEAGDVRFLIYRAARK